MFENLNKRFEEMNRKIDRIYRSVEQARKLFLWTLIITIIAIVLPLIGLIFAIPVYLKTLNIQI